MAPLVHLLCAFLLWAGAVPVLAQVYPTKPIRIVVPFPPAGSADLLSRTIGQKLTAAWGQPIVVDNRPGAGGNLGLELVALGKARPGEIIFASQGAGTLSHLEQELLKTMGGFKALHVPYKGSAPGIADLMAGNVQLFFDSIPSALPHIKSGRVRAIGVASSARSPALPEVPAIGESLKGFAADSWFGLLMPAGTPRDLVNRFDGEVQKALASQEVKERLLAVGGFVQAGGPGELAARVREDLEKWGKVARATGVKIE